MADGDNISMLLETDAAKKDEQRAKRAEYMRTVYYPKHREKVKAYQAKYHRANPELKNERERRRRAEQPERLAASFQKYKATHEDVLRRRRERYYEAKREAIRARQAEYRKNNPDVWADAQKRRRAKTRHAPDVERFKSAEIYERDNWTCLLCGLPVTKQTASLDHIISLAAGGPHTRANVQTAHRVCNSKKGARVA